MDVIRAERAPVALPRRPRVDALLAGAWTRRLTLVIAGGGYGKTTALRALAQTGPATLVTLTPADREIEPLSARLADALGLALLPGLAVPTAAIGAEDRRQLAEGQAAILADGIRQRSGDALLVIDDLDHLQDHDAANHLLRALCLLAPPEMHIVLSGRRLPGLGLGTARGTGAPLEISAPELAFTPEETGALLSARLGVADEDLARRCWLLARGWAAALQLILDRLQQAPVDRRAQTLERLPLLGGQLWQEFVIEMLDRESATAQRVLATAMIAPVVDPELLDGLEVADAAGELDGLERRGLLVAADGPGRRAMSPVLAEIVGQRLDAGEAEALRDRVATWLETAGRLEEALDCRLSDGPTATLAFLERRGHELVARGYGARVAAVLADTPGGRVPALDVVLGEALQSTGDWDGALDRFGRVRSAVPHGHLSAATAWRYGALLYLRGESEQAEAVLEAARLDGEPSGDRALVAAWLSSTLWSRGATERSASAAANALALAAEADAPGAQAAAHVAAALVAASDGDRQRNERHYRAALSAAEQAGDSVQLTRIRANLSSRALEEGDYHLAIAEADRALSVGSGHRFFVALAMCNRAEALLALGEVDEARATLLEVTQTYAALGSLVVCAPQCLLGVIDRERGDLARARVSFERAVQLAEQGDDAHTLVFALAGLAKTLCQDDVAAAEALAERAVRLASSLERAPALCAAATVRLWADDHDGAARIAGDAESEARRTGDRPSLAEALALRAVAQRPASQSLLEAAVELWTEVGNPIGRQRAALRLATCRKDVVTAVRLQTELAARGVTAEIGPPEPDAAAARPTTPKAEVSIITLGRFAVLRQGDRVPSGAWQSRKARDLLKLLAGRRGRSITREAAAEALWPGEPPGPMGNRLSVALSTLRKVLDPERVHPSDHFIAADGQTLALRLASVTIDVVVFLGAAGTAVASAGDRGVSAAEAELRAAEALYTGDFLEEDLYEDWAVDCRETARAAALEISRLLARAASARDDDETASRHLRRLLERDPYDEDAWVALVGAQSRLRRYGEARRQHAIYARRMAELGSEPVALAQTVDARP